MAGKRVGAVGAVSILWFVCFVLITLFVVNAVLMWWARR